MSNQYTCPSCATVLKTAAPVNPGTLIKCPKCAKVFPVPGTAAPAAVASKPVPPAAAPRPAAPPAAVAARPMPPVASSATVPMPAPTSSTSETAAMPAAVPRTKSLIARLPRKLRKYAVQGMGLAAAFGALFYFVFFLVAFTALDRSVATIKAPAGEGGDGDPVAKKKVPLHLAYLNKDFTGIQIIRPDRFAKSAVLEGLPIEEMSNKSIDKSGIDPRQSDLIVTYFDPYPAGAPLKQGQTPEWASFTPPDGGFSASFPGKPRRNVVPRKLGSTEKMTVFSARLSDRFLNKFQVEVLELSNEEVTQGAAAAFRDDIRRAEFLGQKITDVTLDGNAGKEMSNESDTKSRVLARKRVYLIGNRLLRILAEGDRGQIKSEELAKFVDSFKLVPFKSDGGDDATEFADGTPFSWGVVMHFNGTTDGKAVLKKSLEETKEITFQGKTYLRSQKEKMDNVSMCGYLADEQTVLLAPEPTLRKMLFAADSGRSPLLDPIDLLEVDSPLSMVFLVDQYSAMVSEAMRGVKAAVPPQLSGLKPILDVPERTKTFAMTVDPDREVMIRITAEQADASTATESAKGVRQAYDAAKGLYALWGKDSVAQQAPADIKEALLKTIDSLLDNVKTEADGRNLVITVKRPDGLEDLLKKARPLLKERMNAAGGVRRPE